MRSSGGNGHHHDAALADDFPDDHDFFIVRVIMRVVLSDDESARGRLAEVDTTNINAATLAKIITAVLWWLDGEVCSTGFPRG